MNNLMIRCLAMVMGLLFLCSADVFGAAGDVDGSGAADIKDAVVALQIGAGFKPSVNKDADVNGDGKIGLEEAVFVLQEIGNIRELTTWYKDADGDGYSDGVNLLSYERPYENYFKESELITVSGDKNDNDAEIFPVGVSEIMRVEASIQSAGADWSASPNPVSDLTKDERKMRLGALIPPDADRQPKKKFYTRSAPPSSFDWRSNNGNFVTPVKNQGNCGSCWAFSAVAALESQVIKTSGQSLDLSEQIVVSCSGAGSCSGGYPDDVSDFLKNTGTNTETCYPYTETDGNCNNACADWRNSAFKIDEWNYIDTSTVSNIKSAVYTQGPVVAIFTVYTDFYYYDSGVYSYSWGKAEGGHAVVITGWNDSENAFTVKNSWNTSWGESGYFKIAYSELTGTTGFGKYSIAYSKKTSCDYSVSPANNSFNSDGGTGSVSITAQSGCSWTAVSNASWITVTSGNSGTGNGTVNYSVSSYSGTSSRTGTITIAGKTFTVTQSGGSDIVVFPDENLEAAIREEINKPTGDILKADLEKLTFLWFNGLNPDSYKIKNLEGIQYCTNLTELWLWHNQISDISVLAGLYNLTGLYIRNNQISDITPLAGLTNLTYIHFWYCQISDISAVAGLTNLTHIYFWECQISDISAVAGLTNLTTLSFNDNQISDISAVAGLTNLTGLDFSSNQISDISAVAGLNNLTRLNLGSNQISDISAVAGLTNLKELFLNSNYHISDISAVAGLTNLRLLWLDNNRVSDISAIANLTNLGIGSDSYPDLSLSYNQISDISPLAGLTNLTSLFLDSNQISDISALAGLTNLTSLSLDSNQISDISAVAGLTNLTGLYLYDNNISNIKPLVDNTGLGSGDEVYLYSDYYKTGNPLSTNSCTVYIPQLESRGVTVEHNCLVSKNYTIIATAGDNGTVNPSGYVEVNEGANQSFTFIPNTDYQIENVSVDGISVGTSSTYTFSNVMFDHTISVTFKADGGNIVVYFPDKNLEAAIREAINKPSGDILVSDVQKKLTYLNADGLDKPDTQKIKNIEGIQYCTNLESLDLPRNQIGDISAIAGLTNLTDIFLLGNQISDISAVAGLTKLTSLDLSYNQINDISAVTGLTKLTRLALYNNQISDISPLAGLTNMTSLFIYSNKISDINSLSHMDNLEILFLCSNQISDIRPIAGLTNLTYICLYDNYISDLKPLVDNIGINSGDTVDLYSDYFGKGNPLGTTSCTVYIPQLQSRGVTVEHDCP